MCWLLRVRAWARSMAGRGRLSPATSVDVLGKQKTCSWVLLALGASIAQDKSACTHPLLLRTFVS